jgi:hypothetical protein
LDLRDEAVFFKVAETEGFLGVEMRVFVELLPDLLVLYFVLHQT